jgi:hypothetical protein
MRIITRNSAGRAIIAGKKNQVSAQSDGLLHERHGCAILLVFRAVFSNVTASPPLTGVGCR